MMEYETAVDPSHSVKGIAANHAWPTATDAMAKSASTTSALRNVLRAERASTARRSTIVNATTAMRAIATNTKGLGSSVSLMHRDAASTADAGDDFRSRHTRGADGRFGLHGRSHDILAFCTED